MNLINYQQLSDFNIINFFNLHNNNNYKNENSNNISELIKYNRENELKKNKDKYIFQLNSKNNHNSLVNFYKNNIEDYDSDLQSDNDSYVTVSDLEFDSDIDFDTDSDSDFNLDNYSDCSDQSNINILELNSEYSDYSVDSYYSDDSIDSNHSIDSNIPLLEDTEINNNIDIPLLEDIEINNEEEHQKKYKFKIHKRCLYKHNSYMNYPFYNN